MKYDDASWHYGGEGFPKDLPNAAGGTHTGMFLAWAILTGLGSEDHIESPDNLATLQQRTITPGEYFMRFCDGKLTDEDLSDVGNLFAETYFEEESGQFYDDYGDAVDDDSRESLYEVPDTWATYEVIAPVFTRRFESWKAAQPRESRA